jgi:hypothetical protein
MKPVLSRCGYRCDLCLAYQPNIKREPTNQQKLSDGWFKYFGFRIESQDILCEGCMHDSPKLIDKDCPVRPCVIHKALENCAACDEYVCDKLQERIVSFEEIRRKFGQNIPQDDYYCFIQPYENKRRMDVLRKTGEVIK